MIYFIKKYLICFLLIFSILLSDLKYTHNFKKLKIYNLKIFKYIKLRKKIKKVGGAVAPTCFYVAPPLAVLYSNNNRSSTKSKHIDIKFLVIKERVQSRQISIEHLGTNSMIADPLTKGLPPKVFHEHVAHMGVLQFEESEV